jgi:hypothetical protein
MVQPVDPFGYTDQQPAGEVMPEIVNASHINVDRFYLVSGMEPVPDSARCPLDPTDAWVSFRSYTADQPLRACSVSIKGRRLRGAKTIGTFNQGWYSIRPDGSVEPDDKTGDAPTWVQELVDRAISEHTAGVGLIPVQATV